MIEIEAGTELPIATMRLEPSMLVAYAGATWDWHRLHHDAAYARGLGLAGPVVDGQMLGALLAERCMEEFPPGSFVRKLAFRLKAAVYAGDEISMHGRVTDISEEDGLRVVTVEQEVRVGERLAVGPATAEVVLP